MSYNITEEEYNFILKKRENNKKKVEKQKEEEVYEKLFEKEKKNIFKKLAVTVVHQDNLSYYISEKCDLNIEIIDNEIIKINGFEYLHNYWYDTVIFVRKEKTSKGCLEIMIDGSLLLKNLLNSNTKEYIQKYVLTILEWYTDKYDGIDFEIIKSILKKLEVCNEN